MRGLAAMSVVWFHITSNPNVTWIPLKVSGATGWLGVDVFFVISGFIIPYSLQSQDYHISDFPRFMARRIVRLEPSYLASMVIVIALALLSAQAPGFQGKPFQFVPAQLAAHLFYVIPLTQYSWINVVYWTLSYEFAFYVFAGLLWSVLARRHILFIIAVFALTAIGFQLLFGHVPKRMFLFLTGVAAARYYLGIDRLSIFLASLVTAFLVTAASNGTLSALAGILAALAIVFVQLPRYRILGGLGAISYSLYLIHVPIAQRVGNLGFRYGHHPGYETSVSLLALVTTLVGAFLLWYFVERPAHRLARSLFKKKIPAPSRPTS